jgi:hypothetical protein
MGIAADADAQFPLQAAKGESTLLAEDGTSLISYEVSESRVGFKIDRASTEQSGLDAKGFPTIPDLTQFVFDVGFSATKGKRDLFKGGNFTPGFDAAVTLIRTVERTGPGYHQFYGRVRLDQAARKVALFNDVAGTDVKRVELQTATGTDLGFAGGYNAGFSEDVILGLGAIVRRRWNSVEGKDERQVCIEEVSGHNSNGATVSASDCEDRYIGPLDDEWSTQLRADFVYRFMTVGSKGAAIGLLSSFSVDMTPDKSTSYNVSIGPSLHRPGFPQQVVFAALIEGTDIGNRLGNSPKVTDQLRFRVYVGVPFDVFK